MRFIILDVKADKELLSNSNIVILVVAALIAIAVITGIFIWRKKKSKNQ